MKFPPSSKAVAEVVKTFGCARNVTVAIAAIPILFGIVAFTGCGSGDASLRGAITLDGQPLSSGSISLVPVDGGPTVGSTIQDGDYTIDVIAPGRYRVDIMCFGDIEVVTSSAEMERRAQSPQRSMPNRDIAAGAEGNGIELDVARGSQKHDLALTSPPKKEKKGTPR